MAAKAKKSAKKATKRVAKEYPDYKDLVGQAARVKHPESGEYVDGTVETLGEFDSHETPHTAVFQCRQTTEVLVVNPKDIEKYDGAGFPGGI